MHGPLGSILVVAALVALVLGALARGCAFKDVFTLTLFCLGITWALWTPGELGPIIAVLAVLGLVLVAFFREWAPPEVIAMSALCALVALGLLPMDNALDVFSNHAPITIGAMFILSASLEKTGVIDALGNILGRLVGRRLWITLPVTMVVVAFGSAFVNNTPIVAIFLPVILAICRKNRLPASKLLIPLSYAAVLGGCCTLIGTSTNILVSGIAADYNQPPLGMFEFTPLGLLLTAVGIFYVWVFGPWLLPDRLSISAILGPRDRRQFICHVLVKPQSPLVGRPLADTDLALERHGFRIIEVRRAGTRLVERLNQIQVQDYDRVLLAVSSRHIVRDDEGKEKLAPEIAQRYGIENLSVIKGEIIEGIIAPHSRLLGQSLQSVQFRQTYGMLVLAVHRSGRNLATDFQNEILEFGDTLLLLGPTSTFAQMRDEGDLMLLEDLPPEPLQWGKGLTTLGAMAAVIVAVTAVEGLPIFFPAIAACLLVLWMRCITPDQAYKAVDWSILFMLYGMLGLGSAMESTGAARWLASSVVAFADTWATADAMPLVVLALFYLLGNALTEVLSNNATAVVLTPIAINSALSLGLDTRPFIFAVAFSSSVAFASPLGYQTHMMVYGPGGYKFSDFVKFGLPLNLMLLATAVWFIPLYWPFQK